MHKTLLYVAYGFLLLSAILHFCVDVVSQYIRGKRAPGPLATMYYGLNTTYAISQVLFALLALLALREGMVFMSQWPMQTLGLLAAATWLAIGFVFLEYREPKIAMAIFAALLISGILTGH
jgi:hypothetical protein